MVTMINSEYVGPVRRAVEGLLGGREVIKVYVEHPNAQSRYPNVLVEVLYEDVRDYLDRSGLDTGFDGFHEELQAAVDTEMEQCGVTHVRSLGIIRGSQHVHKLVVRPLGRGWILDQ